MTANNFGYCPEDGPKEEIAGFTVRQLSGGNVVAAMTADRLGVYLVFNGPDAESWSRRYERWRDNLYEVANDAGRRVDEPENCECEELELWLDSFLMSDF